MSYKNTIYHVIVLYIIRTNHSTDNCLVNQVGRVYGGYKSIIVLFIPFASHSTVYSPKNLLMKFINNSQQIYMTKTQHTKYTIHELRTNHN